MYIEDRILRRLVRIELTPSQQIALSLFLLLGTCRKQGHHVQSQSHHRQVEDPSHPVRELRRAACGFTTECSSRRLEHVDSLARFGDLDPIFDSLRQGRWIRALDGLDADAAVEDLEGRHSGHAVAFGDHGLRVDVDFGEGDFLGASVFFRKGFEVRCDHLAGAAPVGVN